MTTTLVTNIGTLVRGPRGQAPLHDTTLVIEDGVVAAIGEEPHAPDEVVDAGGLDVIPGLVDGHVHPTIGEWTPAQDAQGWVSNYVHGGTTTLVSAGELHLPGLAFEELTPRTVKSIAFTSRDVTARLRPTGAHLHAGTTLLVSGMTEHDFDEMAEAGIRRLKYIFYDWGTAPEGEAQTYNRWARERGMVIKIHSGGVSRSGSSRIAGHEVVTAADPDVVAHISGGPIPMPDDEIRGVIDDVPSAAIEICTSMNYRATKVTVDHLTAVDALDRLTVGTDTPGGTGVVPRGMLRNLCFLASMCGMDPVDAVAAATDNTARAHAVDAGRLDVGAPADLVLLGPIRGSLASDVLDCFVRGDLPGISQVLVGGRRVLGERSQQTPPPMRTASVRAFRPRA
jgi:enamidase